MNHQWNGWQGSRISGSVRRASIRSAEPEDRRRAYGVRDAGSAFRPHDRTREPGSTNVINSHPQREKEAKRERDMTTTTWVTFLDELTRLSSEKLMF